MLKTRGISLSGKDPFVFSAGRKSVSIRIPADYIVTRPDKVAALVQSRLGLNKKIFARNCRVEKMTKPSAEDFLNKFHLMNATHCAYAYGLFLKDELLAVATFSKGRKMNRLRSEQRSFELIRFCVKDGLTVTGGLTKLLKHFCREKEVGDIMTYIDKQFSQGESFIRAGFIKVDETIPHDFFINKKTFERVSANAVDKGTDQYKLFSDEGNVKLIFTPKDEG